MNFPGDGENSRAHILYKRTLLHTSDDMKIWWKSKKSREMTTTKIRRKNIFRCKTLGKNTFVDDAIWIGEKEMLIQVILLSSAFDYKGRKVLMAGNLVKLSKLKGDKMKFVKSVCSR